jgi:hypothetical protein
MSLEIRQDGTILTEVCDKCGRALNGKGYIEVVGWKICGVCQWENDSKQLEK